MQRQGFSATKSNDLSLLKFCQSRLIWILLTSNVLFACTPSNVAVSSGGDLPYPFAGSYAREGSADSTAKEYAEYLNSTKMFPSIAVCRDMIKQDLGRGGRLEEINIVEVNKPYLARSTMGGAYSIVEVHLNLSESLNKISKKTFQCFVSYASISEPEVWKLGQLHYGGCLVEGHKTFYKGCPARNRLAGVPGDASDWHKGLYR